MKNCLLYIFLIYLSCCVHSETSQCYGSTSNGSIKDAVQLPIEGDNFVIYHSLGRFFGRNYVHSKVYEVITNAYAEIFKSHPRIKFKYAETGWKEGGKFKPHKTHQNGLSVDFMVPVKNIKGQSVYFPTTVFNKFGYSIEFNSMGQYQDLTID